MFSAARLRAHPSPHPVAARRFIAAPLAAFLSLFTLHTSLFLAPAARAQITHTPTSTLFQQNGGTLTQRQTVNAAVNATLENTDPAAQ